MINRSKYRHLIRYLTCHFITYIPSRGIRRFWFKRYFDIGEYSNIMMGFKVRKMEGITIGKITNINQNCMFDSRGGNITIGDNVDIAPEVNIWTLEHDPQDPNFDTKGGSVKIEDFVWIGNRAIILPSITIGRGAVIASGSVVTSDVESWTIMGGVPAKKIGSRNPEQFPRKPYKPFLL